MTGLDEWQKKVIRKATAMVEQTQPELEAIVEQALREHGPLPINNPAVVMQFARILNQVQDESFQLGLRLGAKTVVDALKTHPRPKESEASKQ